MNEQNLNFYNNLEVEPFMQLAEIGGFNTFKDMEMVYPYLSENGSLLEIGAGYGRCLEYLFQKKFKGDIFAVEQSSKLAEYLRLHFGHSAQIIESRIQNLTLKQQVDAAIWMWSGIIDFSFEEQQMIVQQISGMLLPSGILAIDIPRIGYKTIGEHQDEKHIHFDTAFGKLNCYLPDRSDILQYAGKANMEICLDRDYNTSTNKKRTLYILRKNLPIKV